MFLIGSAYHLEIERTNKRSGEFSNINQKVHQWNLKALGLVKHFMHFMWQAYDNIFPTILNLLQRKVINKAKCLICGAKESIFHVLWECPATSDISLKKWALVTQDFRSLWLEMI